jgi:membrane-bound serine protease (ClpP class)
MLTLRRSETQRRKDAKDSKDPRLAPRRSYGFAALELGQVQKYVFLCVLASWRLLFSAPQPAECAIARVELEGAIDPITAEFLVKSIDRAEAERAEFLLVRLHTPGGFASSMEEIITRMLNSRVPVVVYVGPSGAKAASAGFFILLSADVAAMAPGTNTGAAHPLMAIAGVPVEGGEAGKTLAEKITSNATAFLRSIATKRSRNATAAEEGVTKSRSFTEAEALENNLIDLVVRDEPELLRRLDGRRIRLFSGEERALHTSGQPVTDYVMTRRQRFLSTISQPNLALLLGVTGLILLYFEFTHPGFVAPGVVGGICLLLSILGFSFLPINYVGVLLLAAGLGLLVAEVKVQGFGVLGLGGIAALVIGMLILIDSPDPAVRIGLKTALSVAIPLAAIVLLLLFLVVRSVRWEVTTGEAGMIGLVGVAASDIFAEGRVKVRGEYWLARSRAAIPEGKPVRVVGIDNLTLEVEEAQSS